MTRRESFRVISGLAALALAPKPALRAAQPVYLRLNQVGYLPAESKLAFALTNENLTGQAFSVVSPDGARVLSTGSVGNDRGAYGSFAHLYELNFGAMSVPGTYRLRLGADMSSTFAVSEGAYTGVLPATLQFFRVQRCGNTNPLLHGPCHLVDGIVANGRLNGARINATGGWHDAGDYLKFLITVGFATVLMLHAYQRHPQAFADGDGNGTPDVLDEARVGLDWLLKMWDATNQVLYYQVADFRDHNPSGASPGFRLPERDDLDRPETRTVWACEDGKGANVAGKAAAALALAAALWNDPMRSFYDPGLAATYLTAAEQIYAYGKARPAAQPSTADPNPIPPFVFYPEISWQDKMALAAAELYRATGNPSYLNEGRNYASAAGSAGTFYWAEMGALARYEIARLDPSYVPTATALLRDDLATYQTSFNANRFRAAVSQFDWGSAETMVGAALTALWYEDLTRDSAYRVLAQAQRDYLLGANPWGICLVNSVGSAWPHHPHHQVADLTRSELVGFWDEGAASLATFQAQGIQLSLPDPYAAFQSPAAVFHDDVADYVTNEPTISMNAIGLALTSWYGPAWSFSLVITGTRTNQSLSLSIRPSQSDVGSTANLYVAVLYQRGIFFLTRQANNTIGVVPWSGGPFPVFATVTVQPSMDFVLATADTTGYSGVQIWAGYGRDEADMLNNSRYARVHTFP